MGLRYGLLAALTLVLACALLWDRLNPPPASAEVVRDLPAPGDVARVVVGGPPAPPPADPPPSAPPGAVPAPPAADARPPTPTEYTVAAGDTLGGIARSTLGSARRAGEIAAANGFALEDPIRVGQVLRLPAAGAPAPPPPAPEARPEPPSPAAARTHVIARGETLYALARRYYGNGAQWTRIAGANGLAEGDALVVGRPLRIP